MPSSSAPSTVSNSASSPAAWPSVRLRPRLVRPAAVAVHHAGHVGRDAGGIDARDGGWSGRGGGLAGHGRTLPPASCGIRYRPRVPEPTPTTAARTGRSPATAADRRIDGHVRTALATATAALPAGEDRPGQVEMAEAVGRAIADSGRWSCRPAPAPASPWPTSCRPCVSGAKVVVATATKALQDQLAGKDLPFLAEHLDRPFDVRRAQGALELRVPPARPRGHRRATTQLDARRAPRDARLADEIRRLGRLGRDLADRRPGRARLRAVAPGLGRGQRRRRGSARAPPAAPGRASASPSGPARAAAEADVVVVNTHLYGLASRPAAADPARARRGGHRRGPPARGHRLGHLRARARAPAASPTWPASPGPSSTTPT